MAGAHVVRDCRFWLLAFRNPRREEEVGEEGVCIARGGSQSDLHKSVHQFGIDCFPNQQPLDRRHKHTHTHADSDSHKLRNSVYLAKVSKWINFSMLCRAGSAAGRRRASVVVLVVLASGGFRRCNCYCCSSRHSQNTYVELFLSSIWEELKCSISIHALAAFRHPHFPAAFLFFFCDVQTDGLISLFFFFVFF